MNRLTKEEVLKLTDESYKQGMLDAFKLIREVNQKSIDELIERITKVWEDEPIPICGHPKT